MRRVFSWLHNDSKLMTMCSHDTSSYGSLNYDGYLVNCTYEL